MLVYYSNDIDTRQLIIPSLQDINFDFESKHSYGNVMQLSKFDKSISQEVINLVTHTFSDAEGKEEGQLVGALVNDLITTTEENDLFGYVALSGEAIIGSIFFSRLTLPDGKNAFILSPVAIATSHQKMGVGQQLINYGIEQLRKINVDLVFTYGDPNYYKKVGFVQISENIVKAPLKLSFPEGWIAQSLNSDTLDKPIGIAQCVEALAHQKYW